MRGWAEVYDTSFNKVAIVDAIISANAESKLDEAAPFDLQCGLDENVMTYLIEGNTVKLYVQEDNEAPQRWTHARIIKRQIRENGSSLTISVSGRDVMDELRDRVVGLALTYNAQTIQTIASDLVGRVPNWSAAIEAASAALLQTARFDGAKVLKALVRLVEERGLHFRLGDIDRQLEIGAFGTAATTPRGEPIWVMQAGSSAARELYDNDAVLLIDEIALTGDSDSIVNWAIPLGAGAGASATTLKDTTYTILNSDNTTYRAGITPQFPIYRRIYNGTGIEYYIDASAGATQHQDTLSYKEIGPIANSDTASQLASDALANAAMADLARTRVKLTTLALTVRKVRVNVKPGQLLHVRHKGMVSTAGDLRATRPELVYLDVDADYWVMGVKRTISDAGIATVLTVASIDRKQKDDGTLITELVESTEVQNVAIKNYTNTYEKTYYDQVGNAGTYRPATFRYRAKNTVVDVVAVLISFKTIPLDATTASIWIGPSTFQLWWQETDGYNYPSDVSLWINGVDVTSVYGPSGNKWNAGGVNAALDVQDLDITSYVKANGIHNETKVEIKCEARVGEVRFNTGYPSLTMGSASCGRVEMTFNITTNTRDVIPG